LCQARKSSPSDDYTEQLRQVLLSSDVSNKDGINEYIEFYLEYRGGSDNIEQDINNQDVFKQRYNKYLENVEYINSLNADVNNPNAGGYGITEFMDWFDDEINALYMSDTSMEENFDINNNDNLNKEIRNYFHELAIIVLIIIVFVKITHGVIQNVEYVNISCNQVCVGRLQIP
jgi:hypothetical protein